MTTTDMKHLTELQEPFTHTVTSFLVQNALRLIAMCFL